MSRYRLAAAVAAALLSCLWPHWARASTYTLAIGYNGAPQEQARGGAPEVSLRYADDDAAAFYQFAREFSREGRLLTIMDADTQRRFPTEVPHARPPTLAQLRTAVLELRHLLEVDREHGEESAVLFFYSGHGVRPSAAPAGLTLLDGSLTHDMLYDEVLSVLPAKYVHVFIDACYAEAIVRPRDADAASVDLTETDIARYAARTTLARFPNVGAIVATSISAQTHEWDTYRHGVFTHEILSGLRGAADVNFDDKIEYSELYAFLGAANRAVSDSRAKLSVVVRPPAVNARAAIVDAGQMKAAARIAGIPSSAGQVYLEDQFGNRLADVRVENGATLALRVPADRRVFLRCADGEADFVLRADQTLTFEQLTVAPAAARTRGVLDAAMRRGLFAAGFGPNYYRGFVDQTSGLVAVPFAEPERRGPELDRVDPRPEPSTGTSGGGMALFGGGGLTASVGRQLGPMVALRAGLRPSGPSGFTLSIDGAWGQSAYSEGRVLVSAGYRLGVRQGRWDAFAGVALGGGVAAQRVERALPADSSSTASGVVFLAPSVGASFLVAPRARVGSELSLDVLGHRRDNASAVSVLPALYVGVGVDL